MENFLKIYLYLAALDVHCHKWLSLVEASGCYSLLPCTSWVHRLRYLWLLGLIAPGMWNLPGPGIEPVFPALAGGFLSTAIPGKSSVQFSHSVMSDSCDPMDCSTTGFPIHHWLPEFAQTHVHRVSDAIQPSHPLSSPSPPTFNLSQHQGLFQWVSSLHQVDKILEFQLQHQSFQWILRMDLL